jgi:hypothetical protein
MAGLKSGYPWSPIGTQVAPTSSAASRVWTLNEVASYESADSWPAPKVLAFEPIATTTFSGASVTFNSIPQTYAALRLILKSGASTGSPSTSFHVGLQINGDTTSSYFTQYSYAYDYNNQSSGASSSSKWLLGQSFRTNTVPYTCVADFYDYASSTNVPAFTSRYGQTPPNNSPSYDMRGWASGSYTGTIAAITSMTVGTMGFGTTFPAGTTATLYGMGEAS